MTATFVFKLRIFMNYCIAIIIKILQWIEKNICSKKIASFLFKEILFEISFTEEMSSNYLRYKEVPHTLFYYPLIRENGFSPFGSVPKFQSLFIDTPQQKLAQMKRKKSQSCSVIEAAK